MTVKRYGELLGTDDKLAPPRLQGDPTFLFSEYCTWLGAGDTSDDTLPVNCIEWQAASAACTDAHGALPSEAQWEHAARGRGQGRLYPWGDASPACCVASLSRDPVLSECGFGIEPVGTHPAVASCPFADLSRDLVEDLGGSMEELQIDSDDEYSAPCWAHEGVPRDPVCTPMTGAVGHGHIERGGDWSSGGAAALSVLRRPIALGGSTVAGFRCVYPAGAQ
jgi:hypothetical protein